MIDSEHAGINSQTISIAKIRSEYLFRKKFLKNSFNAHISLEIKSLGF